MARRKRDDAEQKRAVANAPITEREIGIILKETAAGKTVAVACALAGVSKGGFYKYLDREPRVRARLEFARAHPDGNVEAALYAAATTPDPEKGWTSANVAAQKEWLAKRRPDEWSDESARMRSNVDELDQAIRERSVLMTPTDRESARKLAADAILGPGSDTPQ